MNNIDSMYRIYHDFKLVEKRLEELSIYIDFEKDNEKVTSSVIREIILSACSSIENASNKFIIELKPVGDEQQKTKANGNDPESISKYIYRLMKIRGYRLDRLWHRVMRRRVDPWGNFQDKKNTFWDAYNKIKHNTDNRTATLKHAIESVCALQALVVFITSEIHSKNANPLWSNRDFVRFGYKGKTRPIDLDSNSKQLRHLIWEDQNTDYT